jgi:uncharacterized membrane protein
MHSFAFAMLATCGIFLLSTPLLRAQTPAATFSSFDAPGAAQGTFPLAINRSGLIVGYFVDGSGMQHGFIRDPNGTFTVVDVGSTGTQLTAVNSRGLLVGDNDHIYPEPGFLRYRNGQLGNLYVPGAKCVLPVAMNDNGEIAGVACLTYPVSRGFIWSPGHSFTFTIPGAGPWISVYALNSSGVIAGAYPDVFKERTSYAFLRDNAGNVTSFDATDTAVDTAATAINASGQVAGWYIDNDEGLPFFRDVDGTITLFTVGTDVDTLATAINDGGVIVGNTDNGVSENAFERDAAGNVTLLTLPVSNVGSTAAGINLSGVIVGTYYDQAYVAHGWEMIP